MIDEFPNFQVMTDYDELLFKTGRRGSLDLVPTALCRLENVVAGMSEPGIP